MARTKLTDLMAQALAGDAGALRDHRDRAARAVMDRVWSYPHQREAIEAIAGAKFATLQANRGGGKTEGIASWALARCIARDGYVVRIGTQTLEGPTDNILDRDGHEHSTIGWIRRLGLAKHAHVIRVSGRTIKSIRFSWGSAIHVHDFESMRALERKRGTTAHLWWFDEAQSLGALAVVFAQLVVPRLADHDGQVVLSGTPGRDVGTMFHRYSTGATPGWARVAYYSYDNVLHGADDEARWQRVLDTTVVPARKRYGLREVDVVRMRALSRDERVAIAAGTETGELAEWVRGLDPDLLREVFGRWVVGAEEYLFAWHKAGPELYYAAVGPYFEDEPHAMPACLWRTDAPVASTIAARVALLPAAGSTWDRRPAQWFVAIGLDIGSVAPSALVALGWASGVPEAYCLYSDTRVGLADGEIFEWLVGVIAELRTAGVQVAVVVADINGMREGTGMEWDRGLRQRVPASIPLVRAYKVDEDSQMVALNLDLCADPPRLRVVCGDALDICARHLRYVPHDPAAPKAARPDLGREVTLPDDSVVYPGNHATDAMRYAASRVPVLMADVKHKPAPLSPVDAAVDEHRRGLARALRR